MNGNPPISGLMGRLAPIAWGLLLLVGVCAIYMGLLRSAMKSYTYDELVEVAHQCAQIVHKQVQGDFQALQITASILGEHGDLDTHHVQAILRKLSDNKSFKRAGLALPDGRLLGSPVLIQDRGYLTQALDGKTGISGIIRDREDGDDVNVYYTPVYTNDILQAVLLAVRSASHFKPLLDISCFGGSGFFAIVDERGAVISASARLDDLGFKNIFEGLRKHGELEAEGVDLLRREIDRGGSAVTDVSLSGKSLYMSVTPIGINSWSLLTFVPVQVVDEITSRIFSGVVTLIAVVLGLLSLLAIYVVISERRHRGALRRSMLSLSSLTENIPGGVVQCSADGGFVVRVASDGFYTLIGMNEKTLHERCANSLLDLIDERDIAEIQGLFCSQLAEGNAFDLSYRLLRGDGKRIWIHHRGQKFEDGSDSVLNCVLLDETEAREGLRSKLLNAQRHRQFFDFSDTILYEFDMHSGDISHSSRYTDKFGHAPLMRNFPQSAIDDGLIHPEDIDIFVSMYESLYDGELRSEGELRMRTASGNFLWCHIQNVAVLDEDNVCTLVLGKITDIDSHKRQLESLRDGALRDPFTRLYNKVATKKMISEYIEEAGEEQPAAMCVIDLDKFKDINDNHGHMFGDKVLFDVAEALRSILPPSSVLGRIGGDEFVAFIKSAEEGLTGQESAGLAANLCRMSTELDGEPFLFSCSIGIARFPQDGTTYEALYGMADDALYSSKKGGRGRCTLYGEGVVAPEQSNQTTQPEQASPPDQENQPASPE